MYKRQALEIAKKSDAVLMGSIGGNTSTSPWYKLPAQLRPCLLYTSEISSNDIRKRCSNGSSIHFFLPEDVIDYIERNDLYGSTADRRKA